MSRRLIEGSYARLRGLKTSMILMVDYVIDESLHADYTDILQELRLDTDDKFFGFDLPHNSVEYNRTEHFKGIRIPLLSKLEQLITYLEAVHQASTRIVEIGSAFNLIQDEELKSRCSDLLSAADHFDRVINQATQVLEERLRSTDPELKNFSGASLVGKLMHKEPAKSRLKFSNITSEHEGYVALYRGVIAAFRNPSHHRFIETVTREQALQICAFVDNLLAVLKTAEINEVQ